MAINELWYDHDLTENMKVRTIPSSIFMDDDKANLIGVRVFNNGQPYQLNGFCTFNVLRADGSTVYGSGVIEGNKAYATLPAASYRVPGRTVIFIRVRENDHTSVMLAISVITIRSRTDTIIDPEELIPSIEEILEQYGKMVIAVDECDDATRYANQAGDNANAMANLAQEKAGLADVAAQNATEKAALAIQAAQTANTAAQTANTAASNADAKAALAQEKADLAQQKADLANTAAQNADNKAALANTAAQNADTKAALAQEKASLADAKAGLANDAAALATEKAGLANTAASTANASAQNADTKAQLADQKATLADEKAALANTAAENADEKAGKADTAADRADAAAELLEGMTVGATQLPSSTQPTAEVTEVDGHYHIQFGIVKGEAAEVIRTEFAYNITADAQVIPSTGWQTTIPVIPQGMYFWVRTTNVWNNGQQTVEYSASRSGLDGSGSVVSVMNKSPDANGNVDLSQVYYTKREVDQKINDESFFVVNEDGALCQKYEEPEGQGV